MYVASRLCLSLSRFSLRVCIVVYMFSRVSGIKLTGGEFQIEIINSRDSHSSTLSLYMKSFGGFGNCMRIIIIIIYFNFICIIILLDTAILILILHSHLALHVARVGSYLNERMWNQLLCVDSPKCRHVSTTTDAVHGCCDSRSRILGGKRAAERVRLLKARRPPCDSPPGPSLGSPQLSGRSTRKGPRAH